jgi:hypothetical protein
MKIEKFFLPVCILICFVADSQAAALADSTKSLPEFRNIEWESSAEHVRGQEKAKYLQSFSGFGTEAISFREKIEGLDTRIDYVFKENKLIEGSYTVISENNFRNDFKILKDFLENHFSKPDYGSGPLYTSDSVWIRISNAGLYTGPSLYWVFNNGFIGLISEKFREEISISILYAYDRTIDDYNEQNLINLKDFKIIIQE